MSPLECRAESLRDSSRWGVPCSVSLICVPSCLCTPGLGWWERARLGAVWVSHSVPRAVQSPVPPKPRTGLCSRRSEHSDLGCAKDTDGRTLPSRPCVTASPRTREPTSPASALPSCPGTCPCREGALPCPRRSAAFSTALGSSTRRIARGWGIDRLRFVPPCLPLSGPSQSTDSSTAWPALSAPFPGTVLLPKQLSHRK